ncbi:filamentous hemagglutinin N-terminal domain-containing protein [Candidatus Parabeggiatoa sp. HSG14]|uniref:filamentous hemagglutinin N-terminal domain-containing protein n=1 Tax=Candidatus Parabeggiatoa sp. HSG14 TaxID=3055593 RepID=UPI0025A8DF8A|nr:filamentous hemagglutinin N-terminal domain-containing protein [Thiotrichales bacterium HSG14]
MLKKLSIVCFLLFSIHLSAGVVTDGSVGPRLDLPGIDYQIGADLGQQKGDNLFHSFQDFNLQNWESATFSGPGSVTNIISRVTGGNRSKIDGVIRSTIPNADMYFLNPYGIMFGPNARLEVMGAFHASTADYLRFSDGKRFSTTQPNNPILSVAPVEAFGLLTDVTHCTSKVNTRVVQNEILLIVTDFGDTPLTPRTRVEPNII